MTSSCLFPAGAYRAARVRVVREIDRRAIALYGIPGAVLMENAGRALADAVATFPGRRVLVLAGPGNNGGDGLVAARTLAGRGFSVRILLIRAPETFRGDAAVHWRPVQAMKIPFSIFHSPLRQCLMAFFAKFV